jgi:hypothetical protein
MAFSPVSSRFPRCRRLWNSERLAPLRFYGRYFRLPLLLAVLALTGDKLLFYGGIPLAAEARGEWDYLRAERALAGGRDQEALIAIRQALLETRGEARFWRLAARISGRLNSPEEAYCWSQADRLDPGSIDTELALAEAALKQDQPELATSALREITPDAQHGARYELAAGQLAQAQDHSERARYWFMQVEAGRARDARTLFVLAGWHGALGSASDQARARMLLLELAARPAQRLEALRALVGLDLRRRDSVTARSDGRTLLATPGATFADRLAQLDAAASVDEVDSQLAALLRAASRDDAAQALDWMAAHDRAKSALNWMEHQNKSWRDDPVIGPARARCLAALATGFLCATTSATAGGPAMSRSG